MKTNVVLRKNSWLLLLVFTAMGNMLKAQNKIGINVHGGTSNIEVNGLGILDLLDPYIKSIPQYSAGFEYERGFNSHWSVVTGANYTSRGFSVQEDLNIDLIGIELPVGARIDTRLNYLEVPVTLKYNFIDHGVTPYVKAGVSAGYATSGKMQPTVNAIINWKLPSIPINLENDLYNRFDVSAVASAGVSIPTNDIGSFQLEIGYRHSLNDMFLDNITDIRIKSNGISAGIGYTMRF